MTDLLEGQPRHKRILGVPHDVHKLRIGNVLFERLRERWVGGWVRRRWRFEWVGGWVDGRVGGWVDGKVGGYLQGRIPPGGIWPGAYGLCLVARGPGEEGGWVDDEFWLLFVRR